LFHYAAPPTKFKAGRLRRHTQVCAQTSLCANKFAANFAAKFNEQEEKLDKLFSYHETGHGFDAGQVKQLMDAISDCKILDPACGSGAFPMGVLNKLAFIMEKLDPDNELWKEKQLEKADAFDDPAIREKVKGDIEAAFKNNELGYGRKLYLIENCIYGVDIQPIAIQISKLRFFISLMVDQKTGGTIDNNYNILPLPNLETKFVATNTLLGIRREQGGFANPKIEETQAELLEIRHRHFNPRTVKEKDKLREKDIELTRVLSDLLKEDGFYNARDAAKMAKWNPYNQTEPSDFFDAWWMFGISGGFDVVIGNPPYVRADNPAIAGQRKIISQSGQYQTLWEKWDLMIPAFNPEVQHLAQ
jgi:hypothetical protein